MKLLIHFDLLTTKVISMSPLLGCRGVSFNFSNTESKLRDKIINLNENVDFNAICAK